MTVRYWRDHNGFAHVIEQETEVDDALHRSICGALVPEDEIQSVETLQDIEPPHAVDCHEAWEDADPVCPRCESAHMVRDEVVRIDRETKETLDTTEIFKCVTCGKVFKEVEDDDH